MALGISGTTMMFALIEGVLLRPMPVREQERLIVAWKEFPTGRFAHWPFQAAEIDVIGRESRLLERVGGLGYTGAFPEPMVEGGQASEISTPTSPEPSSARSVSDRRWVAASSPPTTAPAPKEPWSSRIVSGSDVTAARRTCWDAG
jgi:hypothetical protein